MITLTLSQAVTTAVDATEGVLRVATMFGLGIDRDRTLEIVPPITLTLTPGQVVFITGASGSGKSTLLSLIADALAERAEAKTVRFDRLPPLPDRPLVDAFEPWCQTLDQTLKLLAYAGINDAFVMLRKPSELSDGQRYRLRLAQAMAMCQDSTASPLHVILADEFGATLDRTTAHVIARNVRKWTARHAVAPGVCFIAATTHDDLLEPFDPDVLIEKPVGQQIHIMTRDELG